MKHTHFFLLSTLSILLSTATASADFEIESIGARVGFDEESRVNLESYEAVLVIDTPWEWKISESVELDVEFELTGGALTGDGDSAGIFHAGFLFELEFEDFPISIIGGTGPTLMTEDEFDQFDMGSKLQFTTSLGLNLELHESFSIGYRFQHISNGGLDARNPGLDMHAFTAAFSF